MIFRYYSYSIPKTYPLYIFSILIVTICGLFPYPNLMTVIITLKKPIWVNQNSLNLYIQFRINTFATSSILI